MPALITTLIDKLDGFEIVRDKIAEILVVESASQQALATAAGKNPRLWALRVFVERSNAWEQFLDNPDLAEADDGGTPIVNVALNDVSADQSKGNVVERQQVIGTINVDCYGYGVAKSAAVGHVPSDERGAREAQRAARLVRNIVMAGAYTYLDLRGLVGQRWLGSLTMFQPAIDARAAEHVVGARLAFQISFNEFSLQVEGVPLELVSSAVTRAESGQLLLNADFSSPGV